MTDGAGGASKSHQEPATEQAHLHKTSIVTWHSTQHCRHHEILNCAFSIPCRSLDKHTNLDAAHQHPGYPVATTSSETNGFAAHSHCLRSRFKGAFAAWFRYYVNGFYYWGGGYWGGGCFGCGIWVCYACNYPSCPSCQYYNSTQGVCVSTPTCYGGSCPQCQYLDPDCQCCKQAQDCNSG
jgi:hypothetical protein